MDEWLGGKLESRFKVSLQQSENANSPFTNFRFQIPDQDEGKVLSGFQLLIATFRHLKNPFQILLIPLTMWSGFEQGFFGADFTAVSVENQKLK